MYKKYINVVFISVFLIILAVPIMTINTKRDKKLTAENRMAAPFPTFFDKDGKLNGGGYFI